MVNIFQEAINLLDNKPPETWSEEEQLTVNAAQIPLNILPEFNEMTTRQGLNYLADLKRMEELAEIRDAKEKELERFKKPVVVEFQGKESPGTCDFNCSKTGEPLILFGNKNGHQWVCHMSCLREQYDLYIMNKAMNKDHNIILSQGGESL